jgi:hypothetical protein
MFGKMKRKAHLGGLDCWRSIIEIKNNANGSLTRYSGKAIFSLGRHKRLDPLPNYSRRLPLTAEKKTESSVKKFTIWTVWLNDRIKISGALPQL